MAKYVLIYKGGRMATSDEERATVMAAWGQWFGRLGAALTDGGAPFGPSSAVANGTEMSGAPSQLTGYSILTADDLAAATVLAGGCPVLTSGGSVEVYETINMM